MDLVVHKDTCVLDMQQIFLTVDLVSVDANVEIEGERKYIVIIA